MVCCWSSWASVMETGESGGLYDRTGRAVVFGVEEANGVGVGASRPFKAWPRWVMSRVPSETSTPGIAAKATDTSRAHWVKPARKRSLATTGLAARRRSRRNLCKWRTVNSKTSAFSNFAMPASPCSAAKAPAIKSFNSSKHRLILARRCRSNNGFVTFRKQLKETVRLHLFFFVVKSKSRSSIVKTQSLDWYVVNLPFCIGQCGRWGSHWRNRESQLEPFCFVFSKRGKIKLLLVQKNSLGDEQRDAFEELSE